MKRSKNGGKAGHNACFCLKGCFSFLQLVGRCGSSVGWGSDFSSDSKKRVSPLTVGYSCLVSPGFRLVRFSERSSRRQCWDMIDKLPDSEDRLDFCLGSELSEWLAGCHESSLSMFLRTILVLSMHLVLSHPSFALRRCRYCGLNGIPSPQLCGPVRTIARVKDVVGVIIVTSHAMLELL